MLSGFVSLCFLDWACITAIIEIIIGKKVLDGYYGGKLTRCFDNF
jgi:hypothetical protein